MLSELQREFKNENTLYSAASVHVAIDLHSRLRIRKTIYNLSMHVCNVFTHLKLYS